MTTNLFDRLAEEERGIFGQEFIGYASNKGDTIRICVGSILMGLSVNKGQGIGIYRPKSYRTAKFVRKATLVEKDKFIKHLPIIRLVVCDKVGQNWFGASSTGEVPIADAQDSGIQLFDSILCRFDGIRCIYDCIDQNSNLHVAEVLRSHLQKRTKISEIETISAVTPLGVSAYKFAFRQLKDLDEDRIKDYIKRGGGNFASYKEIGGVYTVTYEIQNQTFTSVIRKDMKVESAGICLSGTDKEYDLQSLISVVKEGIQTGQINRVGIPTPYRR